jgi:hypothetical protein
MILEESDLEILHDIGNRRALLKAPRSPMLKGTLAATMRRRHELMAELARLEQRWIERGLASAGLPCGGDDVVEAPTLITQRAPRTYRGPLTHHF